MQNESGVKLIYACNYTTAIPCGGQIANGKVIGEFVCDKIDEHICTELKYGRIYMYHTVPTKDLTASCLDWSEVENYGNGKPLYFWHISDLVIYDVPRELGEFYQVGKSTDFAYYDYCSGCPYHETPVCEYPCNECDGNRKYLYRPPQSWCYVEVNEK